MLQDESLTRVQHEKIASIIEDTEEMEQMVDELLYFAKVERPDTILNIEPIALRAYIEVLLNKNFPNNHRNMVVLDVPEAMIIDADSALVKRLINNLLSNALRYVDQEVRLSANQDEDAIFIIMEDDGPGIPVEHWSAIFEPFYSADRSRNKSNTGFGLGLAIVKLIIDRHGGNICVGASSLGGAKFTIRIPRLSHLTDNL